MFKSPTQPSMFESTISNQLRWKRRIRKCTTVILQSRGHHVVIKSIGNLSTQLQPRREEGRMRQGKRWKTAKPKQKPTFKPKSKRLSRDVINFRSKECHKWGEM